MKRLVLVLAVAALAGCGGGSQRPGRTATTAGDAGSAMKALTGADPAVRGTVRTLFESAGWAVVQSASGRRASAYAFHLVGGRWIADRSGKVKLTIVGPRAGTTTIARPHVAMRFATPSASVESALWIDGSELVEQGRGTPTRGTIYGVPLHALEPGRHLAVAYARSRSHGAAVAWMFSVR